jgi:hypothetical protein
MAQEQTFRNPGRRLSYASEPPYPTIEDVEVDIDPKPPFGLHSVWRSARKGVIATFPSWDNIESDPRLKEADRLPVGTAAQHFVDADQDWFFEAWAQDGYVYVIEGLDLGQWERRHRMPMAAFESAWRRGVDRIRQVHCPTLSDVSVLPRRVRERGRGHVLGQHVDAVGDRVARVVVRPVPLEDLPGPASEQQSRLNTPRHGRRGCRRVGHRSR